jgi:hypothetical protein
MSWRGTIGKDPATWRAVAEYAQERIETLTTVCTSVASSDLEIRQAQFAIQELQMIASLPERVKGEADMRGAFSSRKEY